MIHDGFPQAGVGSMQNRTRGHIATRVAVSSVVLVGACAELHVVHAVCVELRELLFHLVGPQHLEGACAKGRVPGRVGGEIGGEIHTASIRIWATQRLSPPRFGCLQGSKSVRDTQHRPPHHVVGAVLVSPGFDARLCHGKRCARHYAKLFLVREPLAGLRRTLVLHQLEVGGEVIVRDDTCRIKPSRRLRKTVHSLRQQAFGIAPTRPGEALVPVIGRHVMGVRSMRRVVDFRGIFAVTGPHQMDWIAHQTAMQLRRFILQRRVQAQPLVPSLEVPERSRRGRFDHPR